MPRSRLRGQHHLGAEEAHQPAPLDAELLRHGHHQRIALGGAHHGEPDAGVAAGRLDDGLPGLELARLLGRLDHAQRQPILDRAQRIERLDLDEQVHARRRQPVDPHDGRVADRLQDTLEFASHARSPSATWQFRLVNPIAQRQICGALRVNSLVAAPANLELRETTLAAYRPAFADRSRRKSSQRAYAVVHDDGAGHGDD